MTANTNKYELGPMSNLSQVVGTPFATYHSAEAMRERFSAAVDVVFDAVTRCLVLQPRTDIADMVLAEWDLTGDWALCNPAAGSWSSAYLHAYSSVGDAQTTAASKYLLPPAPAFALDFIRAQAPPADQTANQRWTIQFGRAFTLEFGSRDDLILRRAGGRTLTRTIEPRERREMWKAENLRWEIQQIGHDLRIACSALGDEWVITDIMQTTGGSAYGIRGESPWIAAGPVSIASTGGAYAFSLQRYSYETSGVVTTPWIETHEARQIGDAVVNVFALPIRSDWGSATCTVSAVNGTKVKLQVAFVGDSFHTPAVGAWQAYWLPEMSIPTTSWQNATPEIESASISMSMDGTATCEMTLSDAEGAASAILTSVNAPGQMACRAYVGYANPPVLTLEGIVHEISISQDPDNRRAVQLRAADRKKQLADVQLLYAPCLIGMTTDEAVETLCRFAGVPAPDTSDLTALARLDDPGRNYNNPPWLPAMGSTALDMINRICTTYGLRLDAFGPTGLRLVQDLPSDTVVASYSAELGVEDAVTLTALELVSDFSDAKNGVLVIGKDSAGRSLYGHLIDPAGYAQMGYWALQVDANDDLSDQAAVNYAARQAFEKLGRPRRRIRLHSEAGTLHDRLPGDIITLTSATLGLDETWFRVLSVRITDDAARPDLVVDVEAEEVLA